MNSEELKTTRAELGFTQQEFADALGVSVKLYRLWEQSKPPTKKYFKQLIELTVEKYK